MPSEKAKRDERERHEYEPDRGLSTQGEGTDCKVCGFPRHHPWHGQ
jgi:hypothetical protein